MLLMSLIFLLKYEAPEYEQNFDMVLELLRAGDVKEDDDEYESPLDELFKMIEEIKDEEEKSTSEEFLELEKIIQEKFKLEYKKDEYKNNICKISFKF